MASIYKQKQKKQLRNAIICCALVFIMLASTIVISISHKMSFYQDFSDKNFASLSLPLWASLPSTTSPRRIWTVLKVWYTSAA